MPVEPRTADARRLPSEAVLDPRIYRTGLVAVALAVIVLAFSLENQPGPLTTTLAPEAFNGGHAYATMTRLAKQYPNRRPGTPGRSRDRRRGGKAPVQRQLLRHPRACSRARPPTESARSRTSSGSARD